MFLFEWWECLARRLYRWLLSLGELSAGGLDEFVLLVALGGGTAGHVGFTTAFAADDGGEVFDEVACSESGVMGVLATEGAEVEFVAIVHDEEGGLGEVKLFEAVDEFLQEVGRTVEGVDEVAGETSIFGELGKEGISCTSCSSGLCFFEGLLGFDCSGLGGGEGGAEKGEGLIGRDVDLVDGVLVEGLEGFVSDIEFSIRLGDFFFE